MNCADFSGVVHDLERAGTQGFTKRVAALEHAEGCARCNALLEKVMLLDFALDAIALEDRLMAAPAYVETAVLAEFRKQHAQKTKARRNLWLTAPLAMAAAAALAIAFGIGHVVTKPNVAGNMEKGRPLQMQQVAVHSSDGAAAPTEVVERAAADADQTEYATNFVLLPFADDPNSLEGGTVVRVTLTREALASFGLPVADVSPNERIPADIALSVDGVPQAIRLLVDDQAN